MRLLRHCGYLKSLHTPKMKMSSSQKQPAFERSSFNYFLPIQSRWADNDQYGHVNNTNYYSYFDTVINHYLIKHCALNTDLTTTNCIGFMVETQCTFYRPISFPEVVLAGLSIAKIGNSSVHYRIGLFAEKKENSERLLVPLSGSFNSDDFAGHEGEACAVGRCIHVFVDPKKNNKTVILTNEMRHSLQRLFNDKVIDSKL